MAFLGIADSLTVAYRWREAVLERMLWSVRFANQGAKAELRQTPKPTRSNIGAAWVVAKVFREKFFAPIQRYDAGLNRHLRNGEPPGQMSLLFRVSRLWCK